MIILVFVNLVSELVSKKIDTKKIYALKVLKKKEILKRNQYEHTMEERRILVSKFTELLIHNTGKCESQLYCQDGLRIP